MSRPAVFLDRDGTIIWDPAYLTQLTQLRLLRGAASAIRLLNRSGFAVVIATNQSGVARGLLTEETLRTIHEALLVRLRRRGARIDAVYYCPYHPEAEVPEYRVDSDCRKPAPGMLLQAARELDLDLSRSYSIGDSARDLEAGRRAGCKTVLVLTGSGRRTEANWARAWQPDHVAADLRAAVTWILEQAE
jgi:D-glycero-D-manno-heptose 1,7-bisphosphate phosphatase